jgi:hypothetical protein
MLELTLAGVAKTREIRHGMRQWQGHGRTWKRYLGALRLCPLRSSRGCDSRACLPYGMPQALSCQSTIHARTKALGFLLFFDIDLIWQ